MTDSLEAAFLQEILLHPADRTPPLILADWYEEQGDPRGELLRLLYELLQVTSAEVSDSRRTYEARLQQLLRDGVQPVMGMTTNSHQMQFALIPPGQFLTESRNCSDSHSSPHRRLDVSTPFLLGTTLVTYQNYEALMGVSSKKSSRVTTPKASLPVEGLTWFDCVRFCNALSHSEGLPAYYDLHAAESVEIPGGPGYRLPTELEWEYACRCGTSTPYFFGETFPEELGNCRERVTIPTNGRAVSVSSPVTFYPPNAFGLFDMHGNLCEWCDVDELSRNAFSREPDRRALIRGGSYKDPPESCRSSDQMHWPLRLGSFGNGMRLARDYETPPRIQLLMT